MSSTAEGGGGVTLVETTLADQCATLGPARPGPARGRDIPKNPICEKVGDGRFVTWRWCVRETPHLRISSALWRDPLR